jgi:hypothetical protein
MDEPETLHKYNYAKMNPVLYSDPTGMAFSSPALGREVHRQIEQQYKLEYRGNKVYTGNEPSGYGIFNTLLRPDILDVDRKIFMEIKPVSAYGFSSGQIQMAAYLMNYPTFIPDDMWEPPAVVTVGDIPIYCFNAGGIIWYTDLAELATEGLILYSISDVMRAWQSAKNMKSIVSPLVRARGVASWGVRAEASAERARLNSIRAQIGLFSSLGMFF